MRALQPGVMHARQAPAVAGAGPGDDPAADREQLQGVGELREVADPVHAVSAGQRLPAAVPRGQRAGVRRHHRPAVGRAPRGEQDDRQVTGGGEGEDPAQLARLPDGLEDQREDPRLRQPERVVQVGRRRGDQLLAGGDRDRVADAAAGPQHRGEHRAGVGDQGDGARGRGLGLGVADRAQPAGHVHEAHAPGAAQLQAGRPGDRRPAAPAAPAGRAAAGPRARCRRSPPTGRRAGRPASAAARARRRARRAGPGPPGRPGRPATERTAARRSRRTWG